MRTSLVVLLLVLTLALVGLAACGGAGGTAATSVPSGGAGDPVAGEATFKIECARCHSVQAGVAGIGPSLAGIGTSAGTMVSGMSAEQFLHQSIVDPNAQVTPGFSAGIMPNSFGTRLTSQQIDDLVAHLLTLK
jgi:mono/diheme cytochrome c family protein